MLVFRGLTKLTPPEVFAGLYAAGKITGSPSETCASYEESECLGVEALKSMALKMPFLEKGKKKHVQSIHFLGFHVKFFVGGVLNVDFFGDVGT